MAHAQPLMSEFVANMHCHLTALARDPRNPITVTLGIWAAGIVMSATDVDLECYPTVGEFLENEMGPDGEPFYEEFEALALELYWKYLVATFPTVQDPTCDGLLHPAAIAGLDSLGFSEWMFSAVVLDMPIGACLTAHRAAAIAMRSYAEREAAMTCAKNAIAQAQQHAKANSAIDYLQATVGAVRWDKTNWWRLLEVMAQAENLFGHAATAAALSFVRLRTSPTVADELRARYNVLAYA